MGFNSAFKELTSGSLFTMQGVIFFQ